MILDFHNLSIPLKCSGLSQSGLYILFSASCGTCYTSEIFELFDFIERNCCKANCLQAVCHRFHDFAFVFVDS